MKRKSLVLVLLLLPFMLLKAQSTNHTDYKNSILINPLSALLFQNYRIQYERGIGEKSSLSLALGFKAPSSILKINGFDSPRLKTNDFDFTGYSIIGEYRWYLINTKKKRTGLYLGMYYKFTNTGQNVIGTYNSINTGKTYPIDMDVNVITNSLGVLLGYKFMLGDRFNLDFLIAGPGYSYFKLKVYERKPMPIQFYVDLASAMIEDIDVDAVSDFIEDIEIDKILPRDKSIGFSLPAFRCVIKVGYSF